MVKIPHDERFLKRDRESHSSRWLRISYSTGRHMEPVDDFEIDEIYETVRDRGLRTLIVECLSSDIFQSR